MPAMLLQVNRALLKMRIGHETSKSGVEKREENTTQTTGQPRSLASAYGGTSFVCNVKYSFWSPQCLCTDCKETQVLKTRATEMRASGSDGRAKMHY